jgi:hypothetical protein
MKRFLKGKWVVPVATLVLTLSIGSAAFAASATTDTAGTDTTTAVTSSTATSSDSAATTDSDSKSCRGQRSDEALLTGATAEQVTAAALAEVGSDATVNRVETDADGNAAYEAHVTKADGTHVTVYVNESFKVVSVEERPAGEGGGRGGHHGTDSGTSTDSNTSTTGSTATSTS